jgi:hypothetical protein
MLFTAFTASVFVASVSILTTTTKMEECAVQYQYLQEQQLKLRLVSVRRRTNEPDMGTDSFPG